MSKNPLNCLNVLIINGITLWQVFEKGLNFKHLAFRFGKQGCKNMGKCIGREPAPAVFHGFGSHRRNPNNDYKQLIYCYLNGINNI